MITKIFTHPLLAPTYMALLLALAWFDYMAGDMFLTYAHLFACVVFGWLTRKSRKIAADIELRISERRDLHPFLKVVEDQEWLKENLEGLRSPFPASWTHFQNLDMNRILYQIKVLGVDFHTDKDVIELMAALDFYGVIEHQNHLIRRRDGELIERLA